MAFTTIVRTLTTTENINKIKAHILQLLAMGATATQINSAMTLAGYSSSDVTTAADGLVTDGKITYT